ncbi:ABC transporter permease [Adhaeribacter rhizoryzae]|uniref:FtsX-like permease family protein n=1 Tax=Adhaeribacter rhizoryzae TaxID=2607907 RepID=A0A5M6D8N9_9BACT|nr:ABC transporter permease [Adhaeribacter rhizoryzae]KAA5542850.1 FtsX-like permease family protein [Adhaeribacter rhizoryzae]
MLKNYLTIAIRNIARNKAFSAINILGLAIGIASCLLIILFVFDEVSYDKHFSRADQIYRVGFNGRLNQEVLEFPMTGAPVGEQLKTVFPEVAAYTRIRVNGSPFVTYNGQTFKEEKFAYADPTFFQVFDFPLLQGDPATALSDPSGIVITEDFAQKYFGQENPMGKVLDLKAWNASYKITGVISKMPANTHFHFDMLASMHSHGLAKNPAWLGFNFYTYVLVKPGTNMRQLETKFQAEAERFISKEVKDGIGVSMAEFRKAGNDFGLFLQPLTSIHLRSQYKFELEPNGNIQYVYIFLAIAGFMLLIACINFMNLSTAGASKRAKEVGIRKVLGSVRQQLIFQFMSESVLISFCALFIAIFLVSLALPVFNDLTGKSFTLDFLLQPVYLVGLPVFGILVGLLAGSYPAFYLSGFRPVAVLKGSSLGSKLFSGNQWWGSFRLRSMLVVFQFFISIALLVGTVVVYRQLTYMQQKAVGYSKEQVLVVQDSYALKKNEKVFKEKIAQFPQVVQASISGNVPVGDSKESNNGFFPQDRKGQPIVMRQYLIDENYLPTLGLKLVAGRNFSKDFKTDSLGVLLNEAAVTALNWQKNPLGQKIQDGNGRILHVVGVLKDFHFESMHQKIGPMVMTYGENSGSVLVKIKTDNIPGLIASLENTWNDLTAEAPFAYSFLDDRFAEVYQTEQKLGKILGIFAGLTIFIACLGLFGLATFTAQQRRKEIGIRKVLGASVSAIVAMLSKDFLKLVLVANLIAWPLAWYGMHQWLQDFAYRTQISWWIFVVAGALAIIIALVTISFQAIKAAVSNPVKSLRNE